MTSFRAEIALGTPGMPCMRCWRPGSAAEGGRPQSTTSSMPWKHWGKDTQRRKLRTRWWAQESSSSKKVKLVLLCPECLRTSSSSSGHVFYPNELALFTLMYYNRIYVLLGRGCSLYILFVV
uniref:Tumor necrosis factor receptor superfamily member 10B-like n=1 Tax=Sus scrofa TaxID=9823 RepID=A0A480H5H3_PIG